MGAIAPLRVFQLRAEARAWLLYAGVFTSPFEAFEPLLADGDLIKQYGRAALVAIIEQACKHVPWDRAT